MIDLIIGLMALTGTFLVDYVIYILKEELTDEEI